MRRQTPFSNKGEKRIRTPPVSGYAGGILKDKKMEKHYCPLCCQQIDEYYETDVTKAWSHYHPLFGLEIWGPADAGKKTLCENQEYIHFQFLGGAHRLVKMGVDTAIPNFDEP